MKIFIVPALLVFGLSYCIFAQAPDLATLNREVVSLFRQGKLDEAIKLSEKVADMGKGDKSYPILAANIAQLRKKRIQATEAERASSATKEERFEELVTQAHRDVDGAAGAYRKALKADQTSVRKDQAALWKAELAWLLYYRLSNLPPEKEFAEQGDSKAVVAETLQLYTQAVSDFEGSIGPSAPATISAVFSLAEFYRNEGEFEKAVPLYERTIQSFEANKNADKVVSVYALRMLASIYALADMNDKAGELAAKISAISGNTENPPKPKYNLSFRSDDYRPPTVKKSLGFRPVSGRYSGVDMGEGFYSGGKRDNSVVDGQTISANVEVVVDESGKVVSAKGVGKDAFLNTTAETGVMKWKFRPLVIDGKPRKMLGYVVYAFRR